MTRFFYSFLLLVVFPLFFLTTCHNPNQQTAKEKLLQESISTDDQKMMSLFQERVQKNLSLPYEESMEAKALNLSLDASAAAEVEKVLAQLAPDAPMKKVNNSPKDSIFNQADSLLVAGKTTIENGALLMGVRNYEEATASIDAVVKKFRASVESEEERTTEFRLENTLILHVAPENFQAMLDELRGLAVVIRERRIWQQDLSAQFVDLKSRLESKYEAKKRLEQFMKSAKNAEEVLPIQRELNAVGEDIEAMTRTARLLTRKAVESTITLTFYQEVIESRVVEASFNDRISAGLQDGWVHFKETLVAGAYNWPYVALGLIFCLTAIFAYKSNKRRARQFQLQAMQAQQQWMIQQQKVPPTVSSTKPTSSNSN